MVVVGGLGAGLRGMGQVGSGGWLQGKGGAEDGGRVCGMDVERGGDFLGLVRFGRSHLL